MVNVPYALLHCWTAMTPSSFPISLVQENVLWYFNLILDNYRSFYLVLLIISIYKALTLSHTLRVMRSLIFQSAYKLFLKLQYFYPCITSFMYIVYFNNFHPHSFPNSSQIHSYFPFHPKFVSHFLLFITNILSPIFIVLILMFVERSTGTLSAP